MRDTGTVEREATDEQVGVGPWPGGEAHWPEDERFDPELLAEGDRRNVIDRFRYWRMEAIVAELDATRHPFHVAIENWGRDFNIGSVVRSANAFGAAGVHIVGRRRWNRRGAMVTDRYQHLQHHPDVDSLSAWAAERSLPVIGVDNVAGSVPIEGRELPRECVLLFGEESQGLSAPAREASQVIVHISQYGSTRSINAGAAAAVAMHNWILQHAEPQP
ncbi:MAG TPA: TrmH family RNA methyltransferase [Ruania sp.]|nr:TrmH family RNA methyltransferase [Ruania sp.]